MGRVLFTNLTMLAGLAVLAVPIVIHLLLRRRKLRLRFSTLRFFDQQDQQSSQRRKLRNLLLLAMRLLLLALLVLAFARPYLPDRQAGGAGKPRRLAVIVMDQTASMQASDGGSTRWAQARESAGKLLAGLGPDDRAALIACGSRSEIVSGPAAPEAVGRLVQKLEPGFAAGTLGEGVRLAAQVASRAGRDCTPTVYVVSDLQVSACRDLGAHPVPRDLELQAVKAGDVIAPNLAVTTLQLDQRGNEGPHVMLASYADEETKNVTLRLEIDEKEVWNRSVALATGNVTRVDLPPPGLAPGWHSGVARIEAKDALALDNACYEAFLVPQPVRVLVVETRVGKRVFEEESFFVTSALDPMNGTTNAGFSRFAVEKAGLAELMTRLGDRQESRACEVVVLPGLKEIPSGLGAALLRFVQAGGGLLLFLGDEVNSSRYQSELGLVLPARLGHIERNAAESADQKWRLDDYDLRAPMFAVFRRPNSGNLALPEFTRRFTLTAGPEAAVPAKFEDGTPVIAGQKVGRGRVVLVNSSADTGWTDWPKHKTYLPWLHSVCYELAGLEGAGRMQVAAHLTAAPDADVPLGKAASRQSLRIVRPGAKDIVATADENGLVRDVDLSRPGVYSIRDANGREMERVAVNLPGVESDLTALTAGAFQEQLVRATEPPAAGGAAGLLGSDNLEKELWRLLLLGVLGLLFAEVLLANRTYA